MPGRSDRWCKRCHTRGPRAFIMHTDTHTKLRFCAKRLLKFINIPATYWVCNTYYTRIFQQKLSIKVWFGFFFFSSIVYTNKVSIPTYTVQYTFYTLLSTFCTVNYAGNGKKVHGNGTTLPIKIKSFYLLHGKPFRYVIRNKVCSGIILFWIIILLGDDDACLQRGTEQWC